MGRVVLIFLENRPFRILVGTAHREQWMIKAGLSVFGVLFGTFTTYLFDE
jgi:hypothetical protein